MGYESNTRDMQNRLMQQQYEEIKSVYLNLRGWRHDYHNHIQVMKAFLDIAQVNECRMYLNEIETELNRVDSFVRSGNLMADAILNSKITRAVEKGIRVNCDAALEEDLFLSDMDLCIILGNILDNAIESCEKIEVEKRFLRIYMTIVKEQLYISVQNAAPEILNFEERNYISTKRGNHGLGMKRVVAVVEKREGFLNLNNEAGIFGTEIMIPKP
ncbi:MAG: GHKL domain-containing protein [Agathobacter sp.]|nr:GHKL domain-containing protein [Agathobacter sp.]